MSYFKFKLFCSCYSSLSTINKQIRKSFTKLFLIEEIDASSLFVLKQNSCFRRYATSISSLLKIKNQLYMFYYINKSKYQSIVWVTNNLLISTTYSLLINKFLLMMKTIMFLKILIINNISFVFSISKVPKVGKLKNLVRNNINKDN